MIKAIMAVDQEFGAGKNGTLPWPKNKKDLKHFKDLTTGDIVVMGSKTWEDPCFPKPLPNRENIVITRSCGGRPFAGADGCIGFGDFRQDIIELDNNSDKDVWIIGGPSIIHQCQDIIEELYLTMIPGTYDCDVLLDIDLDDFELIDLKVSPDNNYFTYRKERKEV